MDGNPPLVMPEQLGQLVFERAPCIAAVIDPDLQLVAVNGAFRDVFGRREGEPCYAVYKERGEPCDDCPVARTFVDRAEHVSEERGHTLDQREITFRTRTVPVPDADGSVGHVLQMAIDTTRLLDLEQGLDQAEKLARVGLTMAGMAHTIKNILSGLEGGTYMVRSGLQRDNQDRVVAGWGMVEKYIDQIGTLVHNLLRYTREDDPRRETVDPAELVAEVTQLYASKAELGVIELRTVLGEGIDPIQVDRGALHACLANLLSNAIDACHWDPSDGKQHHVELSLHQRPGGGCTFQVEDNGMGISRENQPRVLASSFTTKGIRGTGLGLLLSKKSVEEHGGRMAFTSEEGVGTTFRIDLPGDSADEPGDGRTPQ
jgi:signal transduction histidine kinase